MEAVRKVLQRLGDRHLQPIEARRAGMEAFAGNAPLPDHTQVTQVRLGNVPALRLSTPLTQSNRALLLLHGGAFVTGSARSHQRLAAVLSHHTRASVYVTDYRRAPESAFPAALEDAVIAWRALTETQPLSAAIIGDSAGGGLVVSSAVEIRDQCLPAPCAIVCLSPWVDLSCDASSYRSHAGRDPFLNPDGLRQDAESYLQGTAARDPRASPLFADLKGLAPLLVQVGSEEILLDDATRLVERFRQIGGEATLEVWPDMIHVFQAFLGLLPEAAQALERVGKFLSDALDGPSRTGSKST
jgi:acetyl esterase/lipase